jgi:hypothetical protein
MDNGLKTEKIAVYHDLAEDVRLNRGMGVRAADHTGNNVDDGF